MKYVLLLLIPTISFISSCEECDACFTPPETFVFELVDTQGENIFTNGAYDSQQIEVLNSVTNQPVEFQFLSENDLNIIEIGSIGWTTEQVTLLFHLDEIEVFMFSVNAQRLTEDCCSFTRYENILLEGANFQVDNQTGYYTVTIQ